MKTHLVQFDIAWECKPRNHAKVRALLDAENPAPGSLIVLPEMFSTGFSMNLSVTAQRPEREDEAFLSELAMTYQCAVTGGVISPMESGMARNESVTFGPDGGILGRYAKMQPFTLGGEATGHLPGEQVVTFAWQGFVVSPFVCYDLRFPEHFRTAARLGANLFTVLANWPVKRYHHWLTLLQARAIENQAYVIGVNRSGSDPSLHYNGRSVVASPHGHIVADAGEGEGVVTASVLLEEVTQWRADFPALQDIRHA
ncbi:MAG: nitrilase-related carbon-nitrogen hydrolase [Roseimicrobium sp.]